MNVEARPVQPKALLLRAARSAVVRATRAGSFGEIKGVFDFKTRRSVRDAHATRVILASVLGRNSSVIDVGAHLGHVLRDIVRVAPRGKHFAFEPIPELCAQLRAAFPEVDVRCGALSDTNGTAEFFYIKDADEFSGLRLRRDLGSAAESAEVIQVPVTRLDDELPHDAAPTLIKIDVEGAEFNVLRGALDTLSRHRPVVLFEHGIGGADLYDATSGELHDLLTDVGLRIFDLEGNGPFERREFERLYSEPIWNYVAVPRD